MRIHILHVPGAHPERDDIVRRVKEQTETCLHLDPEKRGIMVNWLSTVECAVETDVDQRWSVITQDDALPLPGWQEHLEQATWYSPAPVLGLSYFGSITESAARRGFPYLVGPHLIWGAAVAYERSFLVGLLEWAKWVYGETKYTHDDRLISAYAQKIGKQTALVTRAIFDQPVQESLVGHGGAGSVRRPSLTIESPGPAYSVLPRFVRRSSGGAKDQRDWLATYGTPEQPKDYTFKLLRSGFMTRVDLT